MPRGKGRSDKQPAPPATVDAGTEPEGPTTRAHLIQAGGRSLEEIWLNAYRFIFKREPTDQELQDARAHFARHVPTQPSAAARRAARRRAQNIKPGLLRRLGEQNCDLDDVAHLLRLDRRVLIVDQIDVFARLLTDLLTMPTAFLSLQATEDGRCVDLRVEADGLWGEITLLDDEDQLSSHEEARLAELRWQPPETDQPNQDTLRRSSNWWQWWPLPVPVDTSAVATVSTLIVLLDARTPADLWLELSFDQ